MSNKQPKTDLSHQKKARNKTERLEEKEEEANMLTADMLAAAVILEDIRGNCSPEKRHRLQT